MTASTQHVRGDVDSAAAPPSLPGDGARSQLTEQLADAIAPECRAVSETASDGVGYEPLRFETLAGSGVAVAHLPLDCDWPAIVRVPVTVDGLDGEARCRLPKWRTVRRDGRSVREIEYRWTMGEAPAREVVASGRCHGLKAVAS